MRFYHNASSLFLWHQTNQCILEINLILCKCCCKSISSFVASLITYIELPLHNMKWGSVFVITVKLKCWSRKWRLHPAKSKRYLTVSVACLIVIKNVQMNLTLIFTTKTNLHSSEIHEKESECVTFRFRRINWCNRPNILYEWEEDKVADPGEAFFSSSEKHSDQKGNERLQLSAVCARAVWEDRYSSIQ